MNSEGGYKSSLPSGRLGLPALDTRNRLSLSAKRPSPRHSSGSSGSRTRRIVDRRRSRKTITCQEIWLRCGLLREKPLRHPSSGLSQRLPHNCINSWRTFAMGDEIKIAGHDEKVKWEAIELSDRLGISAFVKDMV